jgi:hypothetical protein
MTTITHIQSVWHGGSISRRHKFAVGILIIMSHFTMGKSVKMGTPLPILEVESRAQKTILDCFSAYPCKRRKLIPESGSEEKAPSSSQLCSLTTPRGKRGDPALPTEQHLIISIANGSTTLESTALLDLAELNKTGVMVISEPGRKATEQAVKWGTHHITPGETATRAKRCKIGVTNRRKMQYTAYATHGLDGDGEGTVVVLVHEKLRYSKI